MCIVHTHTPACVKSLKKNPGLSPRPSSICRCVRCLRRYGHLGARANRPRSGASRYRPSCVHECIYFPYPYEYVNVKRSQRRGSHLKGHHPRSPPHLTGRPPLLSLGYFLIRRRHTYIYILRSIYVFIHFPLTVFVLTRKQGGSCDGVEVRRERASRAPTQVGEADSR